MRRNKVLLVTDMDDTLCDTRAFILDRLFTILTAKKDIEKLEYLEANADTLPTFLFRRDIRDIIFGEVIVPGNYMVWAKPTQLLTSGYDVLIRELKAEYGDDFTSVICTHRGFTVDGKGRTQYWLERQGVEDCFDEVYSIKSSEYPNKIEYLKALYPEHRILLLDDNPLHTPETTADYIKEILIYDGITKLPGYEKQNKFKDLSDLTVIIENLILGPGDTQNKPAKPTYSMIMAVDERGGIGYKDKLPWPHSPVDMKWFKEKTLSKVVVMGRNTFESLGSKPLPHRVNIVISSTLDINKIPSDVFAPDTRLAVVTSIDECKSVIDNYCDVLDQSMEVMVIGGGKIYEQFWNDVTRVYLTTFQSTYMADVFVKIDLSGFDNVYRDRLNPVNPTFEIFDKKETFSLSRIDESNKADCYHNPFNM